MLPDVDEPAADFEATVREAMGDTRVDPVLYRHQGEFDLGGIRYGVVSLFAPWAGPCFVCLKVVAAMKLPTPEPWLHVLDLSHVEADWLTQTFGFLPHGRGETVWVRDGQIIARDEAFAMRPADIAVHTKALFRPS